MVAQEVEKVFPAWVDQGSDGYKRVTFRGFEAVTVEAVRELNDALSATSALLHDTETRVRDLEKRNEELRTLIEHLVDEGR